MDELGLFPAGMGRGADVMFANMGENEALYSMKALSALRRAGVRAEMYPDAVKLGRQLDYANKKNIPFVAIAGTSEIEQGVFTVKDMTSGTQETVTSDSLALKFGRR